MRLVSGMNGRQGSGSKCCQESRGALIINWQWTNPWSPICFPALPYAMQKEEQAFNYRDCRIGKREDTRPHPTDKRHLADVTTTNLRYITER